MGNSAKLTKMVYTSQAQHYTNSASHIHNSLHKQISKKHFQNIQLTIFKFLNLLVLNLVSASLYYL
jgi:hypothetical protein